MFTESQIDALARELQADEPAVFSCPCDPYQAQVRVEGITYSLHRLGTSIQIRKQPNCPHYHKEMLLIDGHGTCVPVDENAMPHPCLKSALVREFTLASQNLHIYWDD